MARNRESHAPSCSWRSPATKMPRKTKKAKKHCGTGSWPRGINLTGGFHPRSFGQSRAIGGFGAQKEKVA